MGELIRTLIRWIIVILIIILIIFLLFKITGKSNKTKKAVDTGVEQLENVTERAADTVEEAVNPEGSADTQEAVVDENPVVVPDTASTSFIGLIGVIILASGTYYIYKSSKATN